MTRRPHRRPRAKVTPEIVERIRALTPGRCQWEIAELTGLSQSAISVLQHKHAIPHNDRRAARRARPRTS